MRKFLLFTLGLVLMTACKADRDDHIPFVDNVKIWAASSEVAPGDQVRVTALGLELDDEIMLCVVWPLSGAPNGEGYADGIRGVIVERTAEGITLLAPGGYPAGELELKLFRRGKVMSLGRLLIADGQPPKEYSLYGITEYDSDQTAISRIDLWTGEQTPVKTLDASQQLACAVNIPGTNTIYGVSPRGGNGAAVGYDLTMRYYRDSHSDRVVTAGAVGNAAAFLQENDGRLILISPTTRMSVQEPVSWPLPAGVTASMIAEYPFVYSDGHFLLPAHTADRTYCPLILNARMDRTATLADPVEADAMIPFRVPVQGSPAAPDGYIWVGGYAVVKDGKTSLKLFDADSAVFGKTLIEVPAAVRSISELPLGGGLIKIYMLCDDDVIRIYDTEKKILGELPGTFPGSEIVLVR